MDTQSKNISIRGVDSQVYDQFSEKIRQLDITIGEAISQMMEQVTTDFDETFPELSADTLRSIAKLSKGSITHHGELTISKQDLVESDMRFNFSHIDVLVFESDIDQEIFVTHIDQITHCNKVRVPSYLPKLKILSKIHHCQEVEMYEVG